MTRRSFRLADVIAAACLLLACARAPEPASATPHTPNDAGETTWLDTGVGRLAAKVYRGTGVQGRPTLVVVLHGDSPSGPPTYQYRFARLAAAQPGGAVFAAVLRPGYSDGERSSDGTRGLTTGDNYTSVVIDAVAQAIAALRVRHDASRVVLVGHSGGAAIGATLLGRHPGLVDAALLVSCPCDVPAWRRHMRAVRGGRIWDVPVSSLSPMDLTAAVPASVRVSMLVGAQDEVTPPGLTTAYAASLRGHGVAVDATVLPDLPHNILLEPVVLEALQRVLADDGH